LTTCEFFQTIDNLTTLNVNFNKIRSRQQAQSSRSASVDRPLLDFKLAPQTNLAEPLALEHDLLMTPQNPNTYPGGYNTLRKPIPNASNNPFLINEGGRVHKYKFFNLKILHAKLNENLFRITGGHPTKFIFNVYDQPWDVARLSVRKTKTIFDNETGIPLYVVGPADDSEPESGYDKILKTILG